LGKIRRKEIENILILGDRAIDARDLDEALLEGLQAAKVSVSLLTNAESPLAKVSSFVIPGRGILEKSGLLLNRAMRLQYTQSVVPLLDGTIPEWRFLGQLAEAANIKIVSGDLNALSDRDLTRWYLANDPLLAAQGLTIQAIKNGGVCLEPKGTGGEQAKTGVSQGASSAA
jgi:NADH dehydrogenase/NADH:ubiquinone oxidoreductase subunit G